MQVALEVPVGSKGLAQFEADLARINVMRLRGDIQTAKHLCGELLAQRTDFAQAQALMGDLCMDSGDFMKAADWYDMAAANSGEATVLHQRAAKARHRVEEVEALAATKRLGIPTSRNKLNILAGVMLGMVLAVCALAFYIGGQLGKREPLKTINQPLSLSPPPSNPLGPPAPSAPAFALPSGDERVLSVLKGSVLGGRVLLAYRDPRGPALVVTLEAPSGEFTASALALDAAQFLRDDPALIRVIVRYLRNGETLAMASLSRVKYDAAVAANQDLATALDDIWPKLEPEAKEKPKASETHGPQPPSEGPSATDASSGT